MPEGHFIASIPGIQINSTRDSSLAISLHCSAELAPDLGCPDCAGKRLRIKAYSIRTLKHGLWGGKMVILHLRVPKLRCCACRRYFMAPVKGVLPKKRATEQFRQEVFHLHHGGLTQKNLSITHEISTATVERWYQDFVAYRVKTM